MQNELKNNVIELKDVSFKYEENKDVALKDISFEIKQGEVIFITGESGSGKTTLLNIINGIIPEIIDGNLSGDIFVLGQKNLEIYKRSLILGNVFQNPRSQFFNTNTTSELVFAMENYGFNKEEMKKRLDEIIFSFKIENILDKKIFDVSSGERQLLALVSSLIMKPKVVIFDEPSANLDYGNAMRLRKEIKKLKNEGKTVIISDHRWFYLKDLLDKIILVKDKQIIEYDSENEFLLSEFSKRTFNLFDYNYFYRNIEKSSEIGLSIRNICYKNILKNVTLDFKKKEVTAIVGVNGAGKTTLAKIIASVLKVDKGEVLSNSRVLYIMQDADFQLFGSSCLKELEITSKDIETNLSAINLLNLTKNKDKHPQTLSGGEKQRLQMAISLVSDNEVIIFDEPTSGLDNKSMDKVVKILEALKKDRTLILISHDYEFIRKTADRIVYINNSHIEEDFYLCEDNIKKLNKIYKEMENYYEK